MDLEKLEELLGSESAAVIGDERRPHPVNQETSSPIPLLHLAQNLQRLPA